MSFHNVVIDTIDWSDFEVLRCSGIDLAASLRKIALAQSAEEAQILWWDLEGVAFAQNTVYGSAVLDGRIPRRINSYDIAGRSNAPTW
ncbi:MAG: hypothetical protein IPL41_11845 [Micropruina sp.]|nr:hypothetical protein [Micropruina sp.]